MEDDFLILKDLIHNQQMFHYDLDPVNNKRFLKIGIKEFIDYMTKRDDSICIVAFDKERPIGFVSCTILEDENQIKGYIEDIYVEKMYRKLGIGSDLMNQVIKDLEERNIKNIKLHVAKRNETVFNFYKKFGFKYNSSDKTSYILIRTN